MRSGADPESVGSWRLSGKLHFLQLNGRFSSEISGISLNGLIQNLFSHQEKGVFKKSHGGIEERRAGGGGAGAEPPPSPAPGRKKNKKSHGLP